MTRTPSSWSLHGRFNAFGRSSLWACYRGHRRKTGGLQRDLMTPFVRAYEREHLRVHRSPVGRRRLRVAGLAESRADQAPKRSALQTSAYVRRGLKPLSITIPPASSSSSFFPIAIPPTITSPCFTTIVFLVVVVPGRFPQIQNCV